MSEEEIKKQFEEEAKASQARWLPAPHPDSVIIDFCVKHAYIRLAFSNDLHFIVYDQLRNVMRKNNIQMRWSNEVFRLLQRKLHRLADRSSQKQLTTRKPFSKKYSNRKLTGVITKKSLYTNPFFYTGNKAIDSHLKTAAVDYITRCVYQDICELSLAEKINTVNQNIRRQNFDDGDYIHQSLLQVKSELQEKFNDEIEYQETQRLLSATDIIEKEADNDSKNETFRDQKEVFYLLESILRKIGCTGNKTEFGQMMDVLSGYSSGSMRQNFSKADENSTAKGKWTDDQKETALRFAYKTALDCKMPPAILKDLQSQLQHIKGGRN